MTRPVHSPEHEQLLQLLAKATEHSRLVDDIILITIGFDGRPCIGGTIASPEQMLAVLRALGGAGEHLEDTREIDIPENQS